MIFAGLELIIGWKHKGGLIDGFFNFVVVLRFDDLCCNIGNLRSYRENIGIDIVKYRWGFSLLSFI